MLRIVLVDDESIVLKGMSHLLKRYYPSHEIVGLFENGYDAINLLSNLDGVDVIITDVKMPHINGVDLVKKIKDINSKIYVIVLSAYSDFNFVRQSMLNGAYDYLLKPCKPTDLCNLLSSIQRIKDNEYMLNHKLYCQKQIISFLAHESGNLTIFNENDSIQMVLLSPIGVYDEYIYDILEKAFIASCSSNYHFLKYHNYILIIFTNYDQDGEKNTKCIQSYLGNMNIKKIRLVCGIYTLKYSKSTFIKAYKYLTLMIEFAEFNQYYSLLSQDEYDKFIKQQKDYSFSNYFDRKKVIELIMASDYKKLNDYIGEAINRLSFLYLDPVKTRKDVIRELLSIESCLKDYNLYISKNIQDNYDIIQEINSCKTLVILCELIRKIILNTCSYYDCVKETPKYIIDAISYIEINYMHDISLTDVAEYIYLNPWYFSAQFKKHMGVPMIEYLNKVRVKAAKELLKQKDLMVYQVAEMVGFNDPTYFSTVFKRFEKITPKQYRKIC